MHALGKGQGTMFAYGHPHPDAVIVSRVSKQPENANTEHTSGGEKLRPLSCPAPSLQRRPQRSAGSHPQRSAGPEPQGQKSGRNHEESGAHQDDGDNDRGIKPETRCDHRATQGGPESIGHVK